MRRPAPKKRSWVIPATAFAIPLMGMLIVMAVRGFAPFGSHSLLYSDMFYQYYPFFVDYREALREGGGLLHRWSIGMGVDYLGLVAYYLASPFAALGVIVPDKLLLSYYSLLMPVKIGLAGLSFALFLRGTFRREDLFTALFGSFYALCAWALCYHWNVMWFDTFALLPLVALGEVRLIRDRRFGLYTVTLLMSVLFNYYIGLFTCIFVLLTFFCCQLCRWRGLGRFFGDLALIAACSLLAIGMTAFLELPALAALQNTQSGINNFPQGFRLNIAGENTWRGLLDAVRAVLGNMGGCVEPDFKEGLPKLYCGVGTILLAVLFLISGKVKFRDKLCSAALLAFFILSFIIRKLDYVWHGFHFTNMIPYRFSFLYSFVLLYMAWRAFLERESFRVWRIVLAALLTLLALFCGDSRGEWVFILYNLGFVLFYAGVLLLGAAGKKPAARGEGLPGGAAEPPFKVEELPCAGEELLPAPEDAPRPAPEPPRSPDRPPFTVEELPYTEEELLLTLEGSPLPEAEPLALEAARRDRRARAARARRHRRASAALAAGMALEIVVNLVNFGCYATGAGVSNFPKGGADAVRVFNEMKTREAATLFYRAETTHTETDNDGALNGYNGISAFTSSANLRVTKFMGKLGIMGKDTYNSYIYEETSPVANLFLALKYMVERDGRVKENPYFTDIFSSGNVRLLENNAFLPLGFLAQPALAEVDFQSDADPFLFQNGLLEAASGVAGEYWRRIPGGNLDITASEGVELTAMVQSRYAAFKGGSADGTVLFTYTADREGLACVHLSFSGRYPFRIYKNGEEVVSDSYYLPQIVSACQVVPGDVLEIRLTCGANVSGNATVRAAILDGDLFQSAYDALSASRLELTAFTQTLVEGRIDCDRDGLLYTSVPWDGNWLVEADGERVEPVLVGDCMIALPLSRGSHTVTLRYHNAAFSLGWRVSLGCAAVFAVMLTACRPRKRGKHEMRRKPRRPA